MFHASYACGRSDAVGRCALDHEVLDDAVCEMDKQQEIRLGGWVLEFWSR